MAWPYYDLERTWCLILFESQLHQSSTLLNPGQDHGQFRWVEFLVDFTVDSFCSFCLVRISRLQIFAISKFADLVFLSVNIFFIAVTLLKFLLSLRVALIIDRFVFRLKNVISNIKMIGLNVARFLQRSKIKFSYSDFKLIFSLFPSLRTSNFEISSART